MPEKIKVAIIGAGSIGALKEDQYDSLHTKNPLTQAHAVCQHFATELVGIVDIDPDKAEKAGNKWTCPAFSKIESLQICQPDIVSICTPTSTHLEVFRQVEALKPKLIILEKPAGQTLKECQIIADSSIPVLVDYSRRFNIAHQMIKSLDLKFYGCRLLYGRGFIHEACHALDLFNWWFGKFESGTILGEGIIDRDPNDPSYPVHLSFERCKNVVCLPVDSREYSVFDIEIVSDCGCLQLSEHGHRLTSASLAWSRYGNYQSLGSPDDGIDTRMESNLLYMIDNAVNFLNGTESLKCTIQDALKVHRIYDHLGL